MPYTKNDVTIKVLLHRLGHPTYFNLGIGGIVDRRNRARKTLQQHKVETELLILQATWN